MKNIAIPRFCIVNIRADGEKAESARHLNRARQRKQRKEQNRARQRNRERSGTEKGSGGSTWTRKNKEITKTSLGRSRGGTAAEAYPKQYNHDNDK